MAFSSRFFSVQCLINHVTKNSILILLSSASRKQKHYKMAADASRCGLQQKQVQLQTSVTASAVDKHRLQWILVRHTILHTTIMIHMDRRMARPVIPMTPLCLGAAKQTPAPPAQNVGQSTPPTLYPGTAFLAKLYSTTTNTSWGPRQRSNHFRIRSVKAI